MNKQLKTEKAPAAIGPYSQGIITNGFLFASGQIPIDPATNAVVDGDITVQAHRVFKNIAELLKAAGLNFSDVVKTTVFLTDLKDFGAVNAIYGEYFTEPYPARSCVQVAALPKGVSIEAEIIAAVK